MTSAGHPRRAAPGGSAFRRFGSAAAGEVCAPLHESAYGRLRAALLREGGGDLALHGPMGVGKSDLLRRMYWDLFREEDAVTPLLFSVPALPFSPERWARRFSADVVQQWIAWERGDDGLAARGVLSAEALRRMCAESRLDALGGFLDRAGEAVANCGSDGVSLVGAIFEHLAAAAEESGRRLALMIDESWRGWWREGAERFYLSQVARAADASPSLRRVWTARHAPGESHPLLPVVGATAEDLALEGVGDDAAMELVDRLAARNNLRYDARVVRDYLGLWAGVPAWLANFVGEAGRSPRDLDNEEHLMDMYVADVARGATSRTIQEALVIGNGHVLAPGDIARAAEERLLWPDSPSRRGRADAAVGGGDEEALRRLAETGLAEYGPSGWRVGAAAVLSDFLRLFVARQSRPDGAARAAVALKRRRLVAHAASGGIDAAARRRQISVLLHAMRGQSLPRAHFMAHRRTTASETVPGTIAEAAAGKWVEMPHALGVFDDTEGHASPRGEAARMPAPVVAWCFDEPGYYRGDESAWAAFPCNASVVTSEELDEVARHVRRIGHELNLNRVTAWLIGDGRYSPEAAERVESDDTLQASTWEDFEKIGSAVLSGRTGPSGRERIDRPEPRRRRREARIVDGVEGDSPDAQVVDLFLPPVADMELVAARSVERLAHDAGYDEETTGEIRMAALEACLNAIERSPNAEKEVRVRLIASPREFTVIVENEGPPFDPQAVDAPALEEKMSSAYKRGWGLALMRKFMDRVVYEPYDGGTRLRMMKRNRTPDISRRAVRGETADQRR